jgi:pimeloyl-ACP methyl ester carboxylesterase
MRRWSSINPVLRIAVILCVLYVVIGLGIYIWQRSMLFFPTHATPSTTLTPWSVGSHTIGFCHEATNAHVIWLMAHGNAGQAADRDYVLPRMSKQDSLYVLEYPGYGFREGSPSLQSMNQAASEAYQLLRSRNRGTPVCVLGESIGSGPACALAREQIPPDKLVLVVPFDSLVHLASRKLPFFPIRLLLHDRWDNVESLSQYAGPVDIFGAVGDTIIPVAHAKELARRVPHARFVEIAGGHNDWSECGQVTIAR